MNADWVVFESDEEVTYLRMEQIRKVVFHKDQDGKLASAEIAMDAGIEAKVDGNQLTDSFYQWWTKHTKGSSEEKGS